MSKNRNNYGGYFRPPVQEAPVEKVEEVQPIVETPVEKVTEAPKVTAEVSGAEKVNVRCKPSKNAQPITVLPKGTKVAVKKSIGEFEEIELKDGTIGYMMSMYLKKE